MPSDERPSNLCGREDQAGCTGIARRAWHAVESSGIERLGHHQPAGGINLADPSRPVRAGTGEDNAHRFFADVMGDGTQEFVNRVRESFVVFTAIRQ